MKPQILLAAQPLEQIDVQFGEPSEVSVRSSDVTLVNLGRAVVGPFALRVFIELTGGRSGAGVYFRWRRVSEQPLVVAWQSVELASDLEDVRNGVVRLLWRHWTVQREASELSVDHSTLAETTVETSAADDIQQIETTLGRSNMPEVRINDQSLPTNAWTLSTAGRRLASVDPSRLEYEYLGGLGLINSTGAASFHSPELAYL